MTSIAVPTSSATLRCDRAAERAAKTSPNPNVIGDPLLNFLFQRDPQEPCPHYPLVLIIGFVLFFSCP
ncbi:hypothetical protein [Sphingomonas fennica]|uniref:hypothetical protein n=1 Tax=Edaphosphingomonas fennica TaxID=114404 RepID=UPI001475E825|nr:hypothetical protein [Sphingomonas fennica]MDX3886071.1 hypothetical protein [Sphingomonas sp.]